MTNQGWQQCTLNNAIRARGIGLHSGKRTTMTLRPAPPDTGVVFRRIDIDPTRHIHAKLANVADTHLGTTLAVDGISVATVEHLLSAVAGLGIDNIAIDLDGPEVPIMDGSASPFVFLLESAGVSDQQCPRRIIRVHRTVAVHDGDKWAKLEPFAGFRAGFTIDFRHPVFGGRKQALEVDFGNRSYVKEISRARTFGFLHDLERLRANQRALGGSVDNAIVLDEHRVVNKEGLRARDEFVRHKILDAIGDLYLLGRSLRAAYTAYRSGHALNAALVGALLDNAQAWEEITLRPHRQCEPIAPGEPVYAV